jgi:voltage-gated sodium channel
MQEKIKAFVTDQRFQNFIISVIIINGITLGLETSHGFMSAYSSYLYTFDHIVIGIFTIEILLRIYAHRLSFFKDGWSLFDFFIVLISLFPANSGFEIFRILRVLRLFRLITVVPQMRKIVMALISTMPGMATIAGLLSLFFYIFAIMATHLYGESFPQWFGTLGESFYTLFQVMTLESWSMGIVRPIMQEHPYAWMFFIPFIFMVTFIMINLIVAVVVDAMNEMGSEKKLEEDIKTSEEHMREEIAALRKEVAEIKEILLQGKLDAK